ncbi:MAG: hypothetical protein AAF629_19350 [Chloroflexota bacterium]
MSMGPISDYSLGKARYQDLELEVRRHLLREEALGQAGDYLLSRPLVRFSAVACLLVTVVIWMI